MSGVQAPGGAVALRRHIDHLTEGAISCGRISHGSEIRFVESGRMKGTAFFAVRDHEDVGPIINMLHNQPGWGGRRTEIRMAGRGCVYQQGREEFIKAVRPAAMLINPPGTILGIDRGEIRAGIQPDQCNWCRERGQHLHECQVLTEVLRRMRSNGEGASYFCGRCNARNDHPTQYCPYPPDFGAARDLDEPTWERQASYGPASSSRAGYYPVQHPYWWGSDA